MKNIKNLALGLSALFVAALGTGAFVSADQLNPQLASPNADAKALNVTAAAALTDCKRQSAANSVGQDIFLSTPSPKVYTGTTWQTVDCVNTTFNLAAHQRALVVGTFNAEADCNGNSPTNGQWCQTRALLSGTHLALTEGAPIAAEPSSFAFDSVGGGSQNWQAHNMVRGWEITCASQTPCKYRFRVETRNHDSTVTGLWLDEVAAHIDIKYGPAASL